MGFTEWIIFGVSFGIIATLFDYHPKNGGFLGSIILSVTGMLLALFLSNLIFSLPTTINLTTSIIALYGAVMFLVTGRGLRRL